MRARDALGSRPSSPFKRMAPLVARAADDKKALDVVLLDVQRVSGLTDYLVIAGVESAAQLQAVEQAVEEVMRSAGLRVSHRDGAGSALWRVLDYGGIMVHLMDPTAREFYQLERLYHQAPRRAWRPGGEARGAPPPPPRPGREAPRSDGPSRSWARRRGSRPGARRRARRC